MLWLLLFACFLSIGNSKAFAQEEKENIKNANTYLDSKAASLDKYVGRSECIQQRLLKRLQYKEQKMLKKLAAKDSALYYQYISQQGISYDSIAVLSNDSAYRRKFALQKNSIIDSLKGVQHFIQNQEGKLTAASGIANKADISTCHKDLSGLQQNLNVQQNIDHLIQKKTASLKSFASQHADIKGIENIQKDVYYGREKIKNWRQLAEEPDDAEAKALEYLQGTEGFDKFLKQNDNAFGGLGSNATAADLQRMGYQTKGSVNSMLQKSLGNNMGAVQQQMGQQVQQYSEKLNGITGKVNDVKGSISEAKQSLQSAKYTNNNLKDITKPDFKINIEKGKPFWQRLEFQFNFQTGRASTDGLKPAMMDIGMNVGYKQNERLSFGIGLGSSLGLGQNWQHVKLSYEGISARAYADWKWIYGFSFQVGYERSFVPAGRAYLPENETPKDINPPADNSNNALKDAFGGQQQTAYLGVMKRYKINSKWNGTCLAGHDILWQQKGMRTPWILRFGWQN
jgi:hypothetical protein